MCFCTTKWTQHTGQLLSESFSVVSHSPCMTTRLIFLALTLYPFDLWTLESGRPHPHLPAYKREVASTDWSEVRSEQGLMRHWDWDTAKQRDLCLEATSTHLLSVNSTKEQRLSWVFSSDAFVCFCVSRVTLLNRVRRSIPVHEVWRMLTAARRIYQPLQVRHTHKLYTGIQTTHIALLHSAWVTDATRGAQRVEPSPLWFFKALVTNACTICVCRVNCWHFPSLISVRSL